MNHSKLMQKNGRKAIMDMVKDLSGNLQNLNRIEVPCISEFGELPKKMTEGASAVDLYANEDVCILSGKTVIVPTGLKIKLPQFFEALVMGRSGMASKGIFTHVGTIDNDYTGDIGVVLLNTTDEEFEIKKGQRIAQLKLAPMINIVFKPVEKLPETVRGSNGFGSTGII